MILIILASMAKEEVVLLTLISLPVSKVLIVFFIFDIAGNDFSTHIKRNHRGKNDAND